MDAPSATADPASGALRLRIRQQELLAELGCIALKGVPLVELLNHASRLTAQGMDCEMAKVMEYVPLENRLLVRAGVGWHDGVVGFASVGADLASPAGYALHTGKPVISNNLKNEERFRTPHLLLEHGIRRAINVILQGDGAPYGVLEIDTRSHGEFSEHDLAFMQGAANILGMAIERQRFEQNLKTAIDRHKTLLEEVNHRVKNSLLMVTSLLSLQARATDQPEIRSQLDSASKRISAIAQAHRRLYRSGDNIETVDLCAYIVGICRDLTEVAAGCTINVEAPEEIDISIERAIPVALLVNELVTNAAKHAYKEGEAPIVDVRVARDGKLIRLSVHDRGIGMPPGFEPAKSKSLGMRIVAAFVRQLMAEVQFRSGQPGTVVELVIPMKDPRC
jgi:two-component sensor histidine kinase